MTVEIVILAMIAAFLGLRLYSVLGRRAEHGEEPMQSRLDPVQGGIGVAPPVRAPERAGVAPRTRELPPVLPSVDRALREIMNADRRFDANAFLEGAKSAYRMILEAFWRDDQEALAPLCDPHVARHFAEAIAERHAAGEVPDNRLVRITDSILVGASLTGSVARVTVRFVADVAAVTRDREGHVVAGSLTDAVEVRDVWTFARDITSRQPDWLLDEADEG